MLHSIGDFERISDHAVNIVDIAKEIHEKKLNFSFQAHEEGLPFYDLSFYTAQ